MPPSLHPVPAPAYEESFVKRSRYPSSPDRTRVRYLRIFQPARRRQLASPQVAYSETPKKPYTASHASFSDHSAPVCLGSRCRPIHNPVEDALADAGVRHNCRPARNLLRGRHSSLGERDRRNGAEDRRRRRALDAVRCSRCSQGWRDSGLSRRASLGCDNGYRNGLRARGEEPTV